MARYCQHSLGRLNTDLLGTKKVQHHYRISNEPVVTRSTNGDGLLLDYIGGKIDTYT